MGAAPRGPLKHCIVLYCIELHCRSVASSLTKCCTTIQTHARFAARKYTVSTVYPTLLSFRDTVLARQIPRILSPIVEAVRSLEDMALDPVLGNYVDVGWGGVRNAKMAILSDFFKVRGRQGGVDVDIGVFGVGVGVGVGVDVGGVWVCGATDVLKTGALATARCSLFGDIVWSHTYSKSMDQPGNVANPARGQLNRENEHFLVPVCA